MPLPISYAPREESIGGNLGTGLGAGLAALANMKMQQYQRQQALSGLFPEQQAEALSHFDERSLLPIIKEHARAQRQLETTQPGFKTIIPDLTEDQAIKIGSLPKGVQNLWYKEYQENPNAAISRLNNAPEKFTSKDINTFAKELHTAQKQEPLNKELTNLAQQQQLRQISAKPQAAQIIPQIPINEQQPITNISSQIAPVSKTPYTPKIKNISERLAEDPTLTKSEAQNLVKADIKERNEAEKISKKYYSDTQKLAEASEGFNKRLDRMSKLIEEGSLPVASAYNTLNSLAEHGIGDKIPIVGPFIELATKIPAALGKAAQRGITSRDTEEFEKLTNDFIREAKAIFGGRIAVAEMQQFLSMIPNLSMTDNGKRSVIRNMKNFNEANKIRSEAAKAIVKENGGKEPPGLQALVDERVKPELDRLAQDFISGVNENAQNPGVQFPWQQVLNPPAGLV